MTVIEEVSTDDLAKAEELLSEPIESTVEEPATDENEVDNVGKIIGVTYAADEPLRPYEKEEERDEHRWELDPASSEDFGDRSAQSSRGAES